MARPRSPVLRAGQRLGDAGLASAEVIAATTDGARAAATAIAAMPMRWMQLSARANALTPDGWMRLCADAAGLWMGVADAAMAPARAAVLDNRSRLRRRR